MIRDHGRCLRFLKTSAEVSMLTPEERALVTEIQDRLIELFVLQDEATRAEDWGQVR